MKKIVIMGFLLIFSFLSGGCCRQKNMLYLFSDDSSGTELYGYEDAKGKIVLDAAYTFAFTEKMDRIAFVVKGNKMAAVNRKGETVLEPFIFDNGPDYIEEGLFRFVENDKIGFADKNGKIVIAAVYDFAGPFKDGRAYYSLGGHREYLCCGEHWVWAGGYETGYIDKKGRRLKK